MFNKFIGKYSRFVIHHPYIVLLFVIFLTVFAVQMAGTIETKKSDIKDLLPQDVEAISTLNLIEDEFGSTNAMFYAIEINPLHQGSDEVRDVRDPRVIRYIDQLSGLAMHTDDVIEVTSSASILKQINNGRLPQSFRLIQELSDKNGLFNGFFSRDYELALIKIRTTDDVNLAFLEIELNKIINQVPKPAGIEVNLGGDAIEGQVMEKTIPAEMSKTTSISLVGILVFILILFRSAKYGLTPLTTIIFGSIWAMGFVGFIGMGMTSQTSGILSMIMGIGIDFGIQVVTRYRLELPNMIPEKAMELTLNKVMVPMSTTTLAALIGFQAMSLGKLTFLADMGTMMSYGVAACMVAAITAVPALIVIFDTINLKNTFNNLVNRFEVKI